MHPEVFALSYLFSIIETRAIAKSGVKWQSEGAGSATSLPEREVSSQKSFLSLFARRRRAKSDFATALLLRQYIIDSYARYLVYSVCNESTSH
jgi:hypothetical protein